MHENIDLIFSNHHLKPPFVVGIVALIVATIFFTSKKRLPRPPGPKGLPVIGNMLQLPREKEWLTYAEWADTYGEIMSVKALNQPIIILNSVKAAVDLLDKRSQIYSGRPQLTMLCDLMGWNNTLGLKSYGENVKEYRRLLHKFMGTKASIEGFMPIQERENKNFLKMVMRDPEHLPDHIRRNAGAIILMMTYGYQIREKEDPFVKIVDEATEQFAQASTPGAFLVDTLPILRYVPEWFPGAKWKKLASKWRQTLFDMADLPYNYSKKSLTTGTAIPSFTTNLLEGAANVRPEDEHAIKWTAASLYGGGADTSVSTVYSFTLAMCLYPEVQKKAQAEIDAVIGPDRLPSFADRPNLPYVEALVQEVLRWNPVTPLGVPHLVTQDDVYNGYHIPKGSIVIFNAWKFLHDRTVHKDPMEFKPERFLSTGGSKPEPDPRGVVFGYGRRTCPGLHVADASIFISIAMLLSVFDIRKAVVNNKVVVPVPDYTSGGISHPKPFPCSVKPRSARAEALILG